MRLDRIAARYRGDGRPYRLRCRLLEDPRTIPVRADEIAAKIVDYPNPPLEYLQRIFEAAGREAPATTSVSHEDAPTFSTNFNGGLYVLNAADLAGVAQAWSERARWLLDRQALLGAWTVHVDQIAFSLAMADTGLQVESSAIHVELPDACATATTGPSLPKAIHYHRSTTVDGLLRGVGDPKVDRAIRTVNAAISAQWQEYFPNATFWSHRYQSNPELGSGIGSRGSPLADNAQCSSRCSRRCPFRRPSMSAVGMDNRRAVCISGSIRVSTYRARRSSLPVRTVPMAGT